MLQPYANSVNGSTGFYSEINIETPSYLCVNSKAAAISKFRSGF